MPPSVLADSHQADPGAFAADVRDAVAAGAPLTLRVGDAECRVTGDLAEAVIQMLAIFGAGQTIEIRAVPETITTGQAADLLGVSRPTVVALVDGGVIPATRVGTHRRLKSADVLAYRQGVGEDRTSALEELAELTEEAGLYDG